MFRHKNTSLISHKNSIFTPEYFVYLLCLPVFPVSVIDKPLCPVCVHLNLLLGSYINSIARKPVVSRFDYHVNYICRYICQAAHMRRIVSHIPEEWFVNESFYFYFQKDIPNGRNALNRTDNTPCQKTGRKDQSVSISF